MKSARITAIALLAALLAACSGLRSAAPPERTYLLRAAPAAAGPAAVPGVLAVLRPAVQPGLDTDNIMLTRAGQELDHFAASRWGEPLPRVIAALAVQSLAGGGGFANVVDAGSAVASDYELLLTVRHFEAAYETEGAPPVIHVAFDCVLTTGSPRHVLGRCDAAASEPAADNRMAAIVAAMEGAAQRALADVRTAAVAAAATRAPAPH
ncbi:MAG TPA: ABC-type transport auxiliary lipoprotein family protein [Steroidobacteraceae bacterium]|nr:ABC-type transport auxiliary lipoprotein family protein [Steroidobacteraceae bacterium]